MHGKGDDDRRAQNDRRRDDRLIEIARLETFSSNRQSSEKEQKTSDGVEDPVRNSE